MARAAPFCGRAYAILNSEGQFWTDRPFRTQREALRYLEVFWARMPRLNVGFTVAPVMVRMAIIKGDQ